MINEFEILAAQKRTRKNMEELKEKYASEVEKAGPAVQKEIKKIYEWWEKDIEAGKVSMVRDRSKQIEAQLHPSEEHLEYYKERKVSAGTALKILDSEEFDIEELKAVKEKGKLHEYFPKDNEELSDEKYEHELGYGVSEAERVINKKKSILGKVFTREELEHSLTLCTEQLESAK